MQEKWSNKKHKLKKKNMHTYALTHTSQALANQRMSSKPYRKMHELSHLMVDE